MLYRLLELEKNGKICYDSYVGTRKSEYGPVEETLVFSTYSKFEFSHQITESQAFVLSFARKTIEFLTAKHWIS